MLALSFFLGVWYVQRLTQRDGKAFEPYLAVAYIFIIGGIIGARLAYVLFHLSDFSGNWSSTFNPFGSDQFGIAGLNLYGGLVLGIIGSFLYCRFKGISVLEVYDYFAPTVGIGLVFGRLGCFLNGCCFGTPTDLPWGISFPPGSIPFSIFQDAHLHPAQIYSSLYGAALFLLLHFVLTRKKFHGQVVALLLTIEAVFRFALEYVRYYEEAMYFSFFSANPTFNQLLGVALFFVGVGIWIVQSRRS